MNNLDKLSLLRSTNQGNFNYMDSTFSLKNNEKLNSVFGDKTIGFQTKANEKTTSTTTPKEITPKTNEAKDPVPPREVIVSSKGTKEQQEYIDKKLEEAREATMGFEGLEEKDHVIYKDENGNKKEEKIVKKNDKTGDTVYITIKYDESGRPISTSVEKEIIGKDGKPGIVDGVQHSFKYDDEGNIIDQKNYGYGNVNILVAISPIKIGPDGKQILSEREKELFEKIGLDVDA